MKAKLIIITVLLSLLASCTFVTSYKQSGAKEYAPVDFKVVKVYSGIPENLKFEPLASVSVNAMDEKKALKALKKEAADLGADAVIDIKVYVLTSNDERCGISGVAVKLK
jgi:hypothetical protein